MSVMENSASDIARRHFGTRCVARLERRGIQVKGLATRWKALHLDSQTQYLVCDNGVDRIWTATDIIAASYATLHHKLG